MQIGNVLLLFVGLAIAIVFMGVKVVPQGYQWTVERFGRYTNTLKPGLNIIIPIMDRIGRKMNVMESVLDIPPQEVITSDNATVQIDAVCFFQVVNTAQAAYEVNNLEHAIRNLLQTNIRTVLGSMELDAGDAFVGGAMGYLATADGAVDKNIRRAMIYGSVVASFCCEGFGLTRITRIKRAQILEAEGLRASAILTAEGKKQAQILEAEGARQAAFLESEARERQAEAEARATQVVSEAIATGNVQAINYFVAQKYIDALGKLASANNSKVVLMPLEASQVIGAVGGIGEIVKATFDSKKA